MKHYIASILMVGATACAPDDPDTTTTDVVQSNGNELSSVLMDSSSGCMTGPTAEFGRFIGDWDIQDWSLSQQDGKTWNEGKGARWNFTCVGDGIAVQDFWMPNGGGKGTNLRIYNPDTQSWDIVWTATGSKGTTSINAKANDQGDLVMNYVSPEQNPPRRIIFFSPTDEGWDWVMQMDLQSTGVWTDVYKIKATRR